MANDLENRKVPKDHALDWSVTEGSISTVAMRKARLEDVNITFTDVKVGNLVIQIPRDGSDIAGTYVFTNAKLTLNKVVTLDEFAPGTTVTTDREQRTF